MATHPPQRILILAIRAIGDVVLTTPLFTLLKAAYPHASLVVLADGVSAQVLAHNPHVDRVVQIHRRGERQASWIERARAWWRTVRELRRERFDVAVDVFSGPRSAMLTLASGAAVRIGEDVRSRVRGFCYTHPVSVTRDRRHLVEQKLELIKSLTVSRPGARAPSELVCTSSEREHAETLLAEIRHAHTRLIALVPGAGSRWRMWPGERFAELGNQLASTYGVGIVLVGGAAERSLCEDVAARMTCPVLNVAGRTTLGELLAVFACADLVIANVTGPMHMAVALNQPHVIGLYGAADTVQYAPWGDRGIMVTKGTASDAYWHKVDYEQDYQRLLQVSVRDVCDRVRQLMPHWHGD